MLSNNDRTHHSRPFCIVYMCACGYAEVTQRKEIICFGQQIIYQIKAVIYWCCTNYDIIHKITIDFTFVSQLSEIHTQQDYYFESTNAVE